MASIIQLKRSSTPGSVPGGSDLVAGELAINIPDKVLYSSDGTTPFRLSGDLYNFEVTGGSDQATLTLTVDNATLSNDSVIFLAGEGIDVAGNTTHITIGGEDASSSNKGVAIFSDTTDFTVSSGDVSLADTVVKTVASDSGSATPSSHGFTIAGTANEIETSGSGATITVGLPNNVTIGGTLDVTSTANFNATTTSTTNTTGAVIIDGGLGLAENLNMGGNLDVDGTATIGSTLDVTSTANFNSTTTSTSTTTGAVIVDGGMGVAENVHIGGTLNVASGETTLSSATVSDLTSGRVVLAGTSGALEDSGNLTFNGSTLAVTGAITASGNLTIGGDLTINGTTTTLNTTTVAVEDSLLKLGANNSADSVDVGWYGLYNDGVDKYAGIFRDASDSGIFKVLSGLTSEPSTTVTYTQATHLAQLDALIDGGSY